MNDILFFLRYINRAIIATAFAFAVLSMAACSTHRDVTDQSVRTTAVHDTIRLTQYSVSRDSVYLHDSVYLEVRGDTVRYTCYRDRWHTSRDTLHDTIYISHSSDSTSSHEYTERSTTDNSVKSTFSTVCDWLLGVMAGGLIVLAILTYLRYTKRTD